jgi:hypothetical protein
MNSVFLIWINDHSVPGRINLSAFDSIRTISLFIIKKRRKKFILKSMMRISNKEFLNVE